MSKLVDSQQIFVWAIKLTSQPDYHALTYYFLDLLDQLPEINQATAYEIYGGSNRKTGETSSICEQLIRRFPLDLSEQSLEDSSQLLDEVNATEYLRPSCPAGNGLFNRVVAAIRDVPGPDRALLLKGQFDAELLKLLESLITLYRNQVALHDSKERDALTKLPNRQSFDRRLLQVCEYYRYHPVADRQDSKGSWIAMLDIDNFKRINDNFGHLYGDEVLLIFSQLMEKHFRFNDFLFRFGGEEFVVIVNLINQTDAVATFERFRESVSQHSFGTVGQVTVSIGLTHIHSNTMPTSLLDRADKALYQAKDGGRNCLVVYEEMASLGDVMVAGDADLF